MTAKCPHCKTGEISVRQRSIDAMTIWCLEECIFRVTLFGVTEEEMKYSFEAINSPDEVQFSVTSHSGVETSAYTAEPIPLEGDPTDV